MRHSKHTPTSEPRGEQCEATKEVCSRPAVARVRFENGVSRFLCRSHYEDTIEQFAPVITDKRLIE